MEPVIVFQSSEAIEQQLAGEKIPAHVNRQLKISETLAFTSMPAGELVPTLDAIISAYIQSIPEERKQFATEHLPQQRPFLMRALLKTNPDVIEYLQEKKLLE